MNEHSPNTKKLAKKVVCFSDFKEEEIPKHIIHFAIGAKEFCILFLVIFVVLTNLELSLFPFLLIFAFSLFFFKIFIVAFSSWSKFERLHKIIEDKKWHIEHQRDEEKKELEAIYKAKGFSHKLLHDVIDTLSSDDNRLLQVMLEEEMGISLGSFIHPIKQAFGSALGMIFASILFVIFYFLLPLNICFFLAAVVILVTSSIISSKFERTKTSKEIIWDLAIAIVIVLITHFSSMIFLGMK